MRRTISLVLQDFYLGGLQKIVAPFSVTCQLALIIGPVNMEVFLPLSKSKLMEQVKSRLTWSYLESKTIGNSPSQ